MVPPIGRVGKTQSKSDPPAKVEESKSQKVEKVGGAGAMLPAKRKHACAPADKP